MYMKINLILFLVVIVPQFLYSQNTIDSILDVGLRKDQYENSQKAIENAQYILGNKDATDRQRVRAYHLMNGAYSVMGENKKAIECSFKAKKLADKIGSKEYSVLALGSIAENYRKLNLYDEALEYYNQALKILDDKSINAKEVKYVPSVIKYEIGNIYYLKNDYSTALQFYKDAINMIDKIPVKSKKDRAAVENKRSSYFLLKGHCYVELKKLDSAEIAYNKVREIIIHEDDRFMMVYLLKSYGNLHYVRENYQSAVDSARKAEKMMFFNDKSFKVSLYELLAKSYAGMKDYKESEKYNQLAQEAKVQDEKEINKATSVAFSETKNELIQKVNDQKKWKQILVVIAALLVLISSAIVYIFRKNAIKNKELYRQTIMKLEESRAKPANGDAHSQKSTTSISKDKEAELLHKLAEFEKSKKFTNKNITIASLSSQLSTNTNYLSEVINTHKNKNFNTYINELRIQYIIHKIHSDPAYHNYKISYLAEECGLPYSSFASVFKNFTGMTPSAFLKQDAVSKKSDNVM